jgi:HKD family nuclease
VIDTRLIQGGKPFGDALLADLVGARDLAIAVAFAKESVLAAVDIEEWCRPGRRLRLLAGTDFAFTELELLRRLELTGQAHCRIFHSGDLVAAKP